MCNQGNSHHSLLLILLFLLVIVMVVVVMIVMTVGLHVAHSAPWASYWGVMVALVELEVLDGVAEAHALHTGAADNAAVHLHDRHLIDQLLSVGHMRLRRQLYYTNKQKQS